MNDPKGDAYGRLIDRVDSYRDRQKEARMDPTTVWRGVAVNEVSGQETAATLSTYEWEAWAKNNKAACSGECKHTIRLDGACSMGWPSKAVAAGKVPRRKGPTHVGDIKSPARVTGGEWVVAEYGFDNLNGPGRMNFSITGTAYNNAACRAGRNDSGITSCGCIHELIEKAHPELVPLIRWHLTGEEGPMHYEANATYFYECYLGIGEFQKPEDTPDKALAALKSTSIYGALPDDEATLAAAMAEPVDIYPEANVLRGRQNDLDKARNEVQRLKAELDRAARDVAECERAVKTVKGELRVKRSAPIREWCERRKPALMAEFIRTMQAFKLWET